MSSYFELGYAIPELSPVETVVLTLPGVGGLLNWCASSDFPVLNSGSINRRHRVRVVCCIRSLWVSARSFQPGLRLLW